MNIAEILLLDFDCEIANTRRVLERIPENDPQWKPHEKSMPIGRLSMHTARLPQFCTRILSTPELNMDNEKFPRLNRATDDSVPLLIIRMLLIKA